MRERSPTVHLICGLNGAGKTTYARELENQIGAVRFTLDEWMLGLYRYRFDDPQYARQAEVYKTLIWTVASSVLALGRPVILDWNQWSRTRRAQWRQHAADLGHPVMLHFIDVPLETALARSRTRNAAEVAGAQNLTEGEVRHLAAMFEAPTADEATELIRVPR